MNNFYSFEIESSLSSGSLKKSSLLISSLAAMVEDFGNLSKYLEISICSLFSKISSRLSISEANSANFSFSSSFWTEESCFALFPIILTDL